MFDFLFFSLYYGEMRPTFIYQAEASDAGITIEYFLRSMGYSRHLLTQLKRAEAGILHNGKPCFTNQTLAAGDRLEIRLPREESSPHIQPVALPFSIVYEDQDLLVVNKPANTPIHPSPGNYTNTLANGLADYFQRRGEPFVYRCINRLDRDTTGLLLLARHALSASLLSAQMTRRQIHRTYRALVEGQTAPEGTITLPIGRKPGSIIERCIDPRKGDPAVTHFRTLASQGNISYLELQLETGRTHQIRVHMSAIGHPLLGDSLYHPQGLPGMERQALHSYGLDFLHPIKKEAMHFTAPLPEDMQKLLATWDAPEILPSSEPSAGSC